MLEKSLHLQQKAQLWFQELQNKICLAIEQLEEKYAKHHLKSEKSEKFMSKKWHRHDPLLASGEDAGGGEMRLLKGVLFEKAGVNFSTVYGLFSEEFRKQIPGTEKDGKFWASGVSVVIHPKSPLIPTVHMNTRMIVTSGKAWFGGGADITPMLLDFKYNQPEIDIFHTYFSAMCNKHNPEYYQRFKKWCDEYFYIKHRQEARGAGGIFYDYLDSGEQQKDFLFTQDVGDCFIKAYKKIVEDLMLRPWTDKDRHQQLVRRGRYVEFNLLYDRGTIFGLKTGGNVEAILMSLPPEVSWP